MVSVDPALEVISQDKPNTSDEASAEMSAEELESKTEVQCEHYLQRHLLLKGYEWVPYDPSTYVRPKTEREDLDNYFYVNFRYDRKGADPSLILSHWSKTLLSVLRKLCGSEFFSKDPKYKVVAFFPNLKMLREKLDHAKSVLSSEVNYTKEDVLELLKSLGTSDLDEKVLQSDALLRVADITEHLGVLVGYLEEQFRPTALRLELVTSYGHIEYNLLQYFFEPGQHVSAVDSDGLPVSFVIKKRRYESVNNQRYLCVSGYGLYWDGYGYEHRKLEGKIPEFEGTEEASSLPIVHLTPLLKEKLIKRGRLYASYSGLHYKLYKGKRVIVDVVAFNHKSGYIRDPNQKIPEIDEEELHLLPTKVYGFNLATKVWTSFFVEHLEPVTFDENAWDHLVLDEDVKTLIKGLVDVTKNSNSSSKIISDVISGKGGGLISVLHGPPGTGKTLTAEAVAELLRRPLYMVGSSELPSSPSGLERSLESILSLATAWDAVLLIDEADVYLEQRSLHELERNALVSVALRVLEYHRGVLFLTTNRISSFDEAFLSRFSIAIKYRELDCAGRYVVWRKFFEMAGSTIIEDEVVSVAEGSSNVSRVDLETLAQKNFNGRTIKNIIRTAQALALSYKQPLGITHVQVVLRAQEKFLDEFSTMDRPIKL
ncbi:P-loop containing nucleoside triphosphate hydrolase protein [Guyanagaster necrorhizus]|uniref:P-loop containing nucleoside triphosphate hydrolase protein n=1 Tax=Guyanagaster necrorhizus TaxID=856835 RepID=A0A9P7W394_9AGAR|nr:P-loop containing nucleoside triphosphate hydrolase protein [Guyanagaster necrorhizus MCA 3950]KAG7451615.1 P-loop containing nucleoside triphosphate hydrolase protein [Guyanagaster necrorhizus MCA 3950]